MLDAALVLADGAHGACLRARHRNVEHRMVGAAAVADAAAHALVVVDVRLVVGSDLDGALGAVHHAAARHAAAAEVRDDVVVLNAGRACLVDHAQDVIFQRVATLGGTARIVRQGCQLVFLVGHVEAQQRERLVFPHGALLVDAAPAFGVGRTGAEFDRQAVDALCQLVFFPHPDQFGQEPLPDDHHIVDKCHR